MKTLHKIWIIALLVMTFSSSFVVTVSAVETENTWTIKEDVPCNNTDLSAIAVNDKIYLMGGEYNFEYNPATDSWITNKTSMPTPRIGFAIAAYQDKIYVLGGFSNENDLGANEVYDPLTDTWQTLQPLLSNMSFITGNVVDGKIFLFSNYLTQVYDVANNSWATKSSMPISVDDHVSVAVNDKIYVMGEWSAFITNESLNRINRNQIYDPKTDTWTLGASSPFSRIFASACAATTGVMSPKRIYVIGGLESAYSSYNTVSVYDPITNTWATGAPMPVPRLGATAAVVNDKIYVFAGGAALLFTPPSNVTLEYTPIDYGTPDPTYSSEQTPIITLTPTTSNSDTSKTAKIPAFLIWLAAILVAIFLSFLTYGLVKTYKKDNPNNP